MWPQQTWGQRSSRGQWPLVQVFEKVTIHIFWCIFKGLGYSDPWVESLSWNLLSFPLISQKPGEMPMFRMLLAKCSILAYISLKIFFFFFLARPWLWRHCDVIFGLLVLILVWKEETPSNTMVPIPWIWGFHFQVHRPPSPLGKTCYKKKLGRLRVKCHRSCWGIERSSQMSKIKYEVKSLYSNVNLVYCKWKGYKE